MVADPADTPVTTPVALTEATAVLLLLQVPPEAVSLRAEVRPVQMAAPPVITPAPAAGVTVTGAVVKALPQPVVTL